MEGLIDRLDAGTRVADAGCGHGQSSLQIAARWPGTTVTGFDVHRPSILLARARAVEAGASTVSFHVADAAEIGPGPFDVVTFFDSLHDMGDPSAVLRRAHEALVDGGVAVVIEPWSLDRLEDGIGNPCRHRHQPGSDGHQAAVKGVPKPVDRRTGSDRPSGFRPRCRVLQGRPNDHRRKESAMTAGKGDQDKGPLEQALDPDEKGPIEQAVEPDDKGPIEQAVEHDDKGPIEQVAEKVKEVFKKD